MLGVGTRRSASLGSIRRKIAIPAAGPKRFRWSTHEPTLPLGSRPEAVRHSRILTSIHETDPGAGELRRHARPALSAAVVAAAAAPPPAVQLATACILGTA